MAVKRPAFHPKPNAKSAPQGKVIVKGNTVTMPDGSEIEIIGSMPVSPGPEKSGATQSAPAK